MGAAIGYARATGKTGVCIATSGPGATNLITGLAARPVCHDVMGAAHLLPTKIGQIVLCVTKIHVGSPANITFWALPDVTVQGVVREISPVPDPVARTYTVKITLQNPPKEVQLGMTINANLSTTDSTNISIPLTALVKDSNGNNAVYIIRDKKAHLVPIKTGEFGKNSVIVTSGLAKGDIVITAGTQQLQEGTAVSQ